MSTSKRKPSLHRHHARLTRQGDTWLVEDLKSRNGTLVNEFDVDRWDSPRKNPDGTANKFAKALKDLPRVGRIGC